MTITVRYQNWWEDFSTSKSFVPRLIRAALDSEVEVISDPRAHVDIEAHSVFCVNNLRERVRVQVDKRSKQTETRRSAILRKDYGVGEKGPASKHLWYSGENLRPPTDWDITLSFDLDPMLGGNFYLPHWAIRLDYLGGSSHENPFSATNETLLRSRNPRPQRPKFACVLAGNPHPLRMTLLDSLSQVGIVDSFGAMFGNPVESKFELFKNYRFALVPENDLYPGYVTEKVVEAWLAGCIPIWWGSDPGGYINPRAVLNLAEMSLDELTSIVSDLESQPSKIIDMVTEPILLKPYDFVALVDFTRKRLLGK